MAGDTEVTIRSSDAYDLARQAVEAMQRNKVWPTPLNFEIWLRCAGEPSGELARAVEQMVAAGTPITEEISEELAVAYLPRQKMHDQVRDTGELLAEQLDSVSKAIAAAQKSSLSYGKTLAGATKELADAQGPEALKKLVDNLTDATRLVHEQNKKLEKRLQASTREVADLRDHLENVRRDALTDALTQLANRKAFDEQLMRACLAADSSGTPLALAILDIDHFKKFNDTWGHQTGDQVIRYVAGVLDRAAPEPALAARYGGEEFALICPGPLAPRVAAILETVRQEVSCRTLKRRATNEDLGVVTLSSGWALRRPGEPIAAFIERADQALYASKQAGRNRVTSAERMPAAA